MTSSEHNERGEARNKAARNNSGLGDLVGGLNLPALRSTPTGDSSGYASPGFASPVAFAPSPIGFPISPDTSMSSKRSKPKLFRAGSKSRDSTGSKTNKLNDQLESGRRGSSRSKQKGAGSSVNRSQSFEKAPLGKMDSFRDSSFRDSMDATPSIIKYPVTGGRGSYQMKHDTLPETTDADTTYCTTTDNYDESEDRVPMFSANTSHDISSSKPVEILLRDKSSKNRIRIDEHMNVSMYRDASANKNAIIGLISFLSVILITALVIALGSRNNINQDKEVAAIIASLDQSATKMDMFSSKGVAFNAWNAWQMRYVSAIKPEDFYLPVTDQTLMDDTNFHHQIYTTYLLLQEGYDRMWIKARRGFVIAYEKGCPIWVNISVYKGNYEVSTSHLQLGDPRDPEANAQPLLTTYISLPQGDSYTAYLHVELGFDGYRAYSLFSVHSSEDILSNLLTVEEFENELATLPTPWPWTDDKDPDCDDTVLC